MCEAFKINHRQVSKFRSGVLYLTCKKSRAYSECLNVDNPKPMEVFDEDINDRSDGLCLCD